MRVETIGDATLYFADCLTVLPTLDKVDCVITDPPYRKTKCGNGNKSLGGMLDRASPLVQSGALFNENSIEFKDWLGTMKLNDAAHVYVCCDYSNTQALLEAKDAARLKLANCRPLIKSNAVINKYGMLDYELIWMFRFGSSRPINDCGVKSTIHAKMNKDSGHPTQKPVMAMERLIKDSGTELPILDLFMGSGTTGVACANLGRKFIGIEIEEKYFEIACERITAAQAQLRLFA